MTTPEILRLTATLEPRGPAAAVILTDEQVASLGGGKAVAVRVRVNGSPPYGGRIAPMGGENLLGFSKAVRTQLGVQAGDTIEVEISLETEPEAIEVPADLGAALDADPGLRAAFDALARSRRKEHVRSVTEAKAAATRERRIIRVVDQLR